MAKRQRFTGTTRKFCSLGRRSVGPACKVSDFIPRDYLLGKLPVTKLTAVRTPREIIASVEDQVPPATGGSVESQLLNGLCSFHVGFPEMRHQYKVHFRIVPIWAIPGLFIIARSLSSE